MSYCYLDSDVNVVDVIKSIYYFGTAFMEFQFYPLGWVKQFDAYLCDLTKWCVVLTIDSLSEDLINGIELNMICQSKIFGGFEYVNFVYLTKSGTL